MSNESEVYTRLLLLKGHGCPIWCPEPADNLPLAYRESGVKIGHVGSIAPDGGFDPLFNICFEADHAINGGRVPNGFEPVVLGDQDVTSRGGYHICGSHVCSKSLKILDNIGTDAVSERRA
jgi:hypothetical protein